MAAGLLQPDPSLDALLGRCRFPPPGAELCCGVSGGADSLALLALAVRAGCVVTAVHVDHGLRSGSDTEADVVADAARRLGAGFRAERVEVAPGSNLEARARAARHAVLGSRAALGHTADDQAETVLVNLLRGAALDGLAGMRPGPRHPILALRRADTHALCAALGLDPVHDPSNTDPAFVRNRVRHELLPLMADIGGRDPVPLLARQADVLRTVADHLGDEAAGVDPTDAVALRRAPVPVAVEALRRWLRTTSAEGHPPDAATVERVMAVARGENRATDVGGGWRVARTQRRLRLDAPEGHGGV
ncbi:tRNA lysidine(34) synthetase TilS [Rhabdothermincola salaria]|uniref:tRNA lysidine(34) synthetase TilS n=1 Tax=Rhabdothermincola salaria TaxID=2903142 RepID=UPI001E36DD05|nr:tRNA lysidine(34) synthetase TilS [Rhabdothermincola salaria]MCD9624651.1 tRNA lysidine(34) synthetase TilS [Rhabdothermincola salaria]